MKGSARRPVREEQRVKVTLFVLSVGEAPGLSGWQGWWHRGGENVRVWTTGWRAGSWWRLSRDPASPPSFSFPPSPTRAALIALSRLSPGTHRAAALGLGLNSVLITGS